MELHTQKTLETGLQAKSKSCKEIAERTIPLHQEKGIDGTG
jgi:hypothetical protein